MAQIWKIAVSAIGITSNLLSAGASLIAIYLFLFKREQIKSVFRLLTNYSFQMTLNELKGKMDRLNDYSVDSDRDEIINIFGDISGQIKGNRSLIAPCNEIMIKIDKFIAYPDKLSEPSKRQTISELRERIRSIDIKHFAEGSEK